MIVGISVTHKSHLVMTIDIDSIFHHLQWNDRQIKKTFLQLRSAIHDCLITIACLQTISFHHCCSLAVEIFVFETLSRLANNATTGPRNSLNSVPNMMRLRRNNRLGSNAPGTSKDYRTLSVCTLSERKTTRNYLDLLLTFFVCLL